MHDDSWATNLKKIGRCTDDCDVSAGAYTGAPGRNGLVLRIEHNGRGAVLDLPGEDASDQAVTAFKDEWRALANAMHIMQAVDHVLHADRGAAFESDWPVF